ncbi:MAG: hypothetical protein R6T99_06305 [Bacteroidales bacterium]
MISRNPDKPGKVVRILPGILLLILLFLFILQFAGGWYLEREIRHALKSMEGPVAIELENVHVRLIRRSVKLEGLALTLRNKRDTLVNFRAEELNVTGIRALKYLRSKELHIGSVEILHPDLNGKMNIQDEILPLFSDALKNDSLGEPGGMERFVLGRVTISGGNINIRDVMGKIPAVNLSSIQLDLRNICYHAGNASPDLRVVYEDLTLHTGAGDIFLPEGFYGLKFDRTTFCSAGSFFEMDALQLTPAYGKYEFGRIHGKQTDRFDVDVSNIRARGLDYAAMLEGRVRVRKFSVEGGNVLIFRDKNIPFDHSIYPPLIRTALMNVPFAVTMDTIEITDSYVQYEEELPLAEGPGMVYFSDMDVRVFHLSNRPDDHADFPSMHIHAQAKLMGQGRVSLLLDLPMDIPRDTFSFYGKLARIDFKEMNPMTIPNAHLRLLSGIADSLIFSARANNDHARGIITMVYHDLSFEVLNKKKGHARRSGFVSFMSNAFVRKNNPRGNRDPKVAEMFFLRDKNKGMPNFVWKTLLSGIKATVLPGHRANASAGEVESGTH